MSSPQMFFLIFLLCFPHISAIPYSLTVLNPSPPLYFQSQGELRMMKEVITLLTEVDLSKISYAIDQIESDIQAVSQACPDRKEMCRLRLLQVSSLSVKISSLRSFRYTALETIQELPTVQRRSGSRVDIKITNKLSTATSGIDGLLTEIARFGNHTINYIYNKNLYYNCAKQYYTFIAATLDNISQLYLELISAIEMAQQGKVSKFLISNVHLSDVTQSSLTYPLPPDFIQQYATTQIFQNPPFIHFQITVPVPEEKTYTVHKIHKIPILISPYMAKIIETRGEYIIIKKGSTHHAFLSSNELDNCIQHNNTYFFSKPYVEHEEYTCELQIMKSKLLLDDCHFSTKTVFETAWTHLDDNRWLYSTVNRDSIRVKCGSTILTQYLNGTGILRYNEECEVFNKGRSLNTAYQDVHLIKEDLDTHIAQKPKESTPSIIVGIITGVTAATMGLLLLTVIILKRRKRSSSYTARFSYSALRTLQDLEDSYLQPRSSYWARTIPPYMSPPQTTAPRPPMGSRTGSLRSSIQRQPLPPTPKPSQTLPQPSRTPRIQRRSLSLIHVSNPIYNRYCPPSTNSISYDPIPKFRIVRQDEHIYNTLFHK